MPSPFAHNAPVHHTLASSSTLGLTLALCCDCSLIAREVEDALNEYRYTMTKQSGCRIWPCQKERLYFSSLRDLRACFDTIDVNGDNELQADEMESHFEGGIDRMFAPGINGIKHVGSGDEGEGGNAR